MRLPVLLRRIVGATLGGLLVVGCGVPPATSISSAPAATPVPPTETPMPVLPTATPTPVPPSATPTPLPATATPAFPPPAPTPTPLPTATFTPRPTNTPPPGVLAGAVEDVVGTWESRFQSMAAFMHFRADGTFDLTETSNNAQGKPYVTGTFWFEGTELHVHDNGCAEPGIYQVWVLKEGDRSVKLTMVKLRDSCRERAGDWQKPMLWIEP